MFSRRSFWKKTIGLIGIYLIIVGLGGMGQDFGSVSGASVVQLLLGVGLAGTLAVRNNFGLDETSNSD